MAELRGARRHQLGGSFTACGGRRSSSATILLRAVLKASMQEPQKSRVMSDWIEDGIAFDRH